MAFPLVRPAMAVLLLSTLVRSSEAAQTQPDQVQIASTLANGSPDERTAAITAVRNISVPQRTPLLVSALVQELDRLRHEQEQRQLALQTGLPLPPSSEQGEYLFSVIEVVTQHKDPVFIRPLMPFIGTGNKVVNSIAAFGELAAADVAAIAASGLSSPTDVHSALFTLRRMLEQPSEYSLSPRSTRLIIDVAKQRLTGIQKPAVIIEAVDLAVATGDLELIQRVQMLAGNQAAVNRLGISEPTLVADIQKKATVALAARGLSPLAR